MSSALAAYKIKYLLHLQFHQTKYDNPNPLDEKKVFLGAGGPALTCPGSSNILSPPLVEILQNNGSNSNFCLFSMQTVIRLYPVDTLGSPWMIQSIQRVIGTYMVIKILSMHIPFSLNIALSESPPSSQCFQVHFFCAFGSAQCLSHFQ